MGLLDGLLGNIVGGMLGGQRMPGTQAQSPFGAQAENPLLQLVLQMLQQNGGIEGILGKFQQAGYGQQAQSWIGTGSNMPINPDVLSQIFGREQMGDLARQMGVSREEAYDGAAQMLPQVIDEMTPRGEIPTETSDLVNQALAILQQNRPR